MLSCLKNRVNVECSLIRIVLKFLRQAVLPSILEYKSVSLIRQGQSQSQKSRDKSGIKFLGCLTVILSDFIQGQILKNNLVIAT